jgi:hypothetical protein
VVKCGGCWSGSSGGVVGSGAHLSIASSVPLWIVGSATTIAAMGTEVIPLASAIATNSSRVPAVRF